jgi:hypothetical protein
MKSFLSGLVATALAVSVTATGLLPATAAPVVVPKVDRAELPIINVQSREYRRDRRESRREYRRDRRYDRREYRRDRREARRDYRRDRHGYYRGHRGYRDYRPGYRRYGDFWFPAAAFIAGAAITGAIANSQPVYRDYGGTHAEWCANRYRSYRAYDNTFQPYNGPRRQCVSPYG